MEWPAHPPLVRGGGVTHGLNSYINSDLSMIVYGGAKISPMCNEIT